MKSYMIFTLQLRSNRLNFVWISSILTRNMFEIWNHENCNSSKSKNKFANSQFANRDSATNCTTRFNTVRHCNGLHVQQANKGFSEYNTILNVITTLLFSEVRETASGSVSGQGSCDQQTAWGQGRADRAGMPGKVPRVCPLDHHPHQVRLSPFTIFYLKTRQAIINILADCHRYPILTGLAFLFLRYSRTYVGRWFENFSNPQILWCKTSWNYQILRSG